MMWSSEHGTNSFSYLRSSLVVGKVIHIKISFLFLIDLFYFEVFVIISFANDFKPPLNKCWQAFQFPIFPVERVFHSRLLTSVYLCLIFHLFRFRHKYKNPSYYIDINTVFKVKSLNFQSNSQVIYSCTKKWYS